VRDGSQFKFKDSKGESAARLLLTGVSASPQPVSFLSQTDTYSAVEPRL